MNNFSEPVNLNNVPGHASEGYDTAMSLSDILDRRSRSRSTPETSGGRMPTMGAVSASAHQALLAAGGTLLS